jgi:hypothetical protein
MFANLYFLRIIERALRRPFPERSLLAAFRLIRLLGRRREFRTGYSQFLRFMEEMAAARISDSASTAGLLRSLRNRLDGAEDNTEEDYASLVLEREGEGPLELRFPVGGETRSVDDIQAGRHRLSLASGQVLWEAELLWSDVIWACAFPLESLELAADTGEASDRPTFIRTLLGGEVQLRIFAGLESGRMEITVRKPERPEV